MLKLAKAVYDADIKATCESTSEGAYVESRSLKCPYLAKSGSGRGLQSSWLRYNPISRQHCHWQKPCAASKSKSLFCSFSSFHFRNSLKAILLSSGWRTVGSRLWIENDRQINILLSTHKKYLQCIGPTNYQCLVVFLEAYLNVSTLRRTVEKKCEYHYPYESEMMKRVILSSTFPVLGVNPFEKITSLHPTQEAGGSHFQAAFVVQSLNQQNNPGMHHLWHHIKDSS